MEAGDDGQYICRNTEKGNSMATDSQPVDVSITRECAFFCLFYVYAFVKFKEMSSDAYNFSL